MLTPVTELDVDPLRDPLPRAFEITEGPRAAEDGVGKVKGMCSLGSA
jgi:hypothetical protein